MTPRRADDSRLTREQIAARLRTLYDDLGQFPAGVACPWPLARIFNELLRQAKQELDHDPVVAATAALKRSSDDDDHNSAQLVGTVRGLAGQITTALEPDSAGGVGGGADGS